MGKLTHFMIGLPDTAAFAVRLEDNSIMLGVSVPQETVESYNPSPTDWVISPSPGRSTIVTRKLINRRRFLETMNCLLAMLQITHPDPVALINDLVNQA